MNNPPGGFTRYVSVDGDYLEKRRLRKSAGWVLLWALGVGAVISGDCSGWNGGLLLGGFGGMAVATLLMSVMYVCMVFTIAELSAALPHAGGFFSFTRNAFGPVGGFLCGLSDAIEYVITPAVIVYYIGGYMQELAPEVPAFVWWLGYYGLFVGINIRGVELTLKVGLAVTALALAVLVVFYLGVVFHGAFDRELLTNVPAESSSHGPWLPHGWPGVFSALPFAIWFYLAIEQLPLAAEEAHDVVNHMPKALVAGIATLLVLALLTLVLNTGVGGGAAEIGKSAAPLANGVKAVFGNGTAGRLMIAGSLAGMIASFHTIIYAYGRVLFALSRAGYLPHWISLTGKNHTPWTALLLGAVVGLACTFLIDWTGETGSVGGALLNMAVFGAVISYTMVMLSYIKLRVSRPNLPRPYRSPLGVPGAVVGGVLSLVALFATLSVEAYRPGVWGVALFLAAGMVYFLVYGRYHLVALAPEEEQALLAQAEDELVHQ